MGKRRSRAAVRQPAIVRSFPASVRVDNKSEGAYGLIKVGTFATWGIVLFFSFRGVCFIKETKEFDLRGNVQRLAPEADL